VLTLGSILAGGEANVTLNYNNNTPFTEKQQYYLWRYANNDHRALRQVLAGKISSGATSSLYSPVVGVQFTNTPTTYRRSFGSYTLSDFTEPGWLVELYVNNVLVDYIKADASGFFTFEVPLVYGNSGVKLQFYGPWGEERSKEQNISIPFNFLPVGEFEYKVSAGMVEDSLHSRFSRANFSYGVARRFTIGGGVEYLSSVTSGNIMPFVNTSLRLASSLLISGEYTYGVRAKGILNYRLPSNVQFELNYTKYEKGQKAINYNYLEERKVAVSVPIRSANFSAFSRLTLNQIIMPATKYTTAELLLSGAIAGVNTNFTTYSLLSDLAKPYTYSNLSLSFKLAGAFILTPQAQFDYNHAEFISIKSGLEKHLFKNGFMSLSYEQNFRNNFSNIEMGLRYDFSFAQVGLSARRNNNITTLVQSASGSLMVDAKTNYTGANSRASVGKGGITLLPYLDLNCNGRREPGEPKAYGLNLRVNGGRVELNDKDSTIRVFNLEPYTNYLVTLDQSGFDNIAWQLQKKTLSIAIDPNMFKLIEVPIAVLGEASGTVYLGGRGGQKGQGRIIVNFYSSDSRLAARTISEADDGYFSYLGLAPGEYEARIDTAQLNKVNMTVLPSSVPFTITAGLDGDVVDGLDFVLRSEQVPIVMDSVVKVPIVKETVKEVPIVKDTIPVTTMYRIQLLALREPIKVKDYFKQLLADVPGLTIEETKGEDGLYHYSSKAFTGISEARKLLLIVRKTGWKQCFISKYTEEKRDEPAFRLKRAKTTISAGLDSDVVNRLESVSRSKQVPIIKDKMVNVPVTTVYRVQLMSLSKPINIKDYFKQLLADVPGLTIEELKGDDGMYYYSSRAFKGISEARELLQIIMKTGRKQCFIATYKGGKRI